MAQIVIPEVGSDRPHGAVNSAPEVVVVVAVVVATVIRVVVVVAIESALEVVEFVRGPVYRHWLWQSSG